MKMKIWIPSKLLAIWNRILHLLGRRFLCVFVEEDLPKKLKKNMVYIVTSQGEPWHASLICPCGCGELMHLNLMTDEKPCWSISDYQQGSITVHPSIWRTAKCKAHFWLRRGRIDWCQ